MPNPFALPEPTTFVLPNLDQLRKSGWAIKSLNGEYCVAWRGAEEVVFHWRTDSWHQLATRSVPLAKAA
jgi:hypothetical protein